MEERYDELTRGLDVLYACSQMIEAGRWTPGDCGFKLDADYFYEVVIDALCCCCETVSQRYNEERELSKWFFSDPVMLEYYQLCRDYSKKRGVKLTENPYMLNAKHYVYEQLGGSYTCDYVLHTKVNHRCASGIQVITDANEFNDELPLLERMLSILDFYENGIAELTAELSKLTLPAIIYFPTLTQRQVAA